jgi:transposase-like protein
MSTRRKFTRDFKVSVIREIENGKTPAEVCRQHQIDQSVLSNWRKEYEADPVNAFSGCGNTYKVEAKVAEYERLVGQLYAENAFLKKALSMLETRFAEQLKVNGSKSCTKSSEAKEVKT